MVDPRISIIGERLGRIDRIIAVSSGKGGVGKSLLASILALTLAKKGYRVGLLDLDFTSPSTHLILGVGSVQPMEEKGIVPPVVHGLKYMSVIYYSGEKTIPLRGIDASNALIELLSTTVWGELDYLVIDMPPGIGDATLDLICFINNLSFLIVTTSSQLAFETVRKLVRLLNELRVPVIGIVENMKMNASSNIKVQSDMLGVRFLEEIPYEPEVEAALGNVDKLLSTVFAKKVNTLTAVLS
ncbi:MAG: ATP-binding protein [Thermoproteota archaeon]